MGVQPKDEGYVEKEYVPVNHLYLDWGIVELKERDTQWDCVDPTGRLTYRPSQRQYALVRPDGTPLVNDATGEPVIVTRYGAALAAIHQEIAKEQLLLEELVTGRRKAIVPTH